MQRCPFCAKEIQEEAVACRHCGRDLVSKPRISRLRVVVIGIAVLAASLVVVAALDFLGIIGLLGLQPVERLGRGKTEIAKLQIDQFCGALGLFRFDVGRYPTTEEGLKALLRNPGLPNWSGAYIEVEELPMDPWGRKYQYLSPGQHGEFDLWTFGADGQVGGIDEDADVTSWQDRSRMPGRGSD